jgi:glycerol kinase
VLAIDQGTSATKAVVVADDGTIVAEATRPVATAAVGDRVTQDPAQVLASVIDAGRAALAGAPIPVDAVGIANQGETVLAWDRTTGVPEGPAISWQDGRAASVCERLRPYADRVQQLTGLPLDPYFSAPKMTWLRSQGARGTITTIDSWLLFHLTGEYVTDVTTASRSAVFDLDARSWSAEALGIFDLGEIEMPRLVSCAEQIGTTSAFGPLLPVTGLAVDQQAALVAEGCLEAGLAKCTYGTGAFLLLSLGAAATRSTSGLATSVAFDAGGEVGYCLDGQSYTAGAAITWLAASGLLDDAGSLDRAVAAASDHDLVVVPALAGLGSPWWAPAARGSIEGIGLETTRDDIVAATVAGVCAQVALICRAAEGDVGMPLRSLRVDGGLTRARGLLQAQADLLQIPVEVYPSPDATALGVAALAACGFHGGRLEAPPFVPTAVVEPVMGPAEATERLSRFEGAVARAIDAAS